MFLFSTITALPLPPPYIALNSTAGFNLLADPTTLKASYLQTSIHLTTQEDGGSCFRASATTVLNALSMHGIAAPVDKGPLGLLGNYWTQDNVVASPCAVGNCSYPHCIGATLEEAARALSCVDGVRVQPIHARDTLLTSAADLSALLKLELSTAGRHIIANFIGNAMDLNHHGHFSPTVAYHPGRDMALVLDVSRYKYSPWWVPVSLLYKGLDTTDTGAKKQRGLMVVSGPG